MISIDKILHEDQLDWTLFFFNKSIKRHHCYFLGMSVDMKQLEYRSVCLEIPTRLRFIRVIKLHWLKLVTFDKELIISEVVIDWYQWSGFSELLNSFVLRKLRVEYSPGCHLVVVVILQVIIAFHFQPNGLSLIYAVVVFMILDFELLSNWLNDLTCVKVYLYCCCLGLTSDYALVLCIKIWQSLVSHVKLSSLTSD